MKCHVRPVTNFKQREALKSEPWASHWVLFLIDYMTLGKLINIKPQFFSSEKNGTKIISNSTIKMR